MASEALWVVVAALYAVAAKVAGIEASAFAMMITGAFALVAGLIGYLSTPAAARPRRARLAPLQSNSGSQPFSPSASIGR